MYVILCVQVYTYKVPRLEDSCYASLPWGAGHPILSFLSWISHFLLHCCGAWVWNEMKVYVKCSAFFRVSGGGPPYQDVWPMVQDLLQAYGSSRLLWGRYVL